MKKALILCLVCLMLLPAGALAEQYTFSFVGDCSIGEAIQNKGQENGYTWMVDQKGYDWPFSLLREYLDNDDYTFANLEVVFTARTRHQDKAFPLVGDPRYAQVLLHSGVDAVNTVNNHCFDFYLEGYQDTMAALDEIGFPHFGSVYVGNPFYDRTFCIDKLGLEDAVIDLPLYGTGSFADLRSGRWNSGITVKFLDDSAPTMTLHIDQGDRAELKDENECMYCHRVHTGFFGNIVAFFHRLFFVIRSFFGK